MSLEMYGLVMGFVVPRNFSGKSLEVFSRRRYIQ